MQLRIHLPTHNHTFSLSLSNATTTILDVKKLIHTQCTGTPKVEGQRLIWHGRVLNDTERVGDVWVDAEVVNLHLAVATGAWEGIPPALPSSTNTMASPSYPPIPPAPAPTPTVRPTTPTLPLPLGFVESLHSHALGVLTGSSSNTAAFRSLHRDFAKTYLERNYRISWPEVFDAPFPSAEEGGVKYESVTIARKPFLQLVKEGEPTAAQKHALNVLTYTFAILLVPPPRPLMHTPILPQMPTHPFAQLPPNVLQQLQLPNLAAPIPMPPVAEVDQRVERVLAAARAAHPNLARPPPREQNILMPLLMIVFRTVLLIYFFSPSLSFSPTSFFKGNALLGVMIVGLVTWEVWRLIQDRMPRFPQHVAGGAPRAAQGGMDMAGALEFVANTNVTVETRILDSTDAPQPSLLDRAGMFLWLMVSTLHPAVWARRRGVLRRREGSIRLQEELRQRTEQEREGNQEGEQQPAEAPEPAQRPEWVRNYVQRVVEADWVDDLD